MAIDLSKILGGSTGTWNVAGFQLPDFGVTEAFANPADPNMYNPQVNYDQGLSSTGFTSGINSGSVGGGSSSGGGGGGSTPVSPSTSGAPQLGDPNYTPSGYTRNSDGTLVQQDVNAYNPNSLSGWGIDFGANRAAYEAYPGQVDSAYSGIMSELDNQRTNAQNTYPDLEGQFTGEINAQRPILDQSYKSGIQNVNSQMTQEGRNREDVLAQARRLFGELMQGQQQKYGGTSSTGQFANEFYGREYARQQGSIRDKSGQNMKSLLDYGNQLKEKYDAQLQSLEAQKMSAISQAKDVLYQRIQAIDSAKVGAMQNKANMKLAALQEMNAQIAQVQAQATQFQQQLYAQRQASDLQLQNQIKLFQATGQNTPTGTSYGVQLPGGTGTQQAQTVDNTLTSSYGSTGVQKRFDPITGTYK